MYFVLTKTVCSHLAPLCCYVKHVASSTTLLSNNSNSHRQDMLVYKSRTSLKSATTKAAVAATLWDQRALGCTFPLSHHTSFTCIHITHQDSNATPDSHTQPRTTTHNHIIQKHIALTFFLSIIHVYALYCCR